MAEGSSISRIFPATRNTIPKGKYLQKRKYPFNFRQPVAAVNWWSVARWWEKNVKIGQMEVQNSTKKRNHPATGVMKKWVRCQTGSFLQKGECETERKVLPDNDGDNLQDGFVQTLTKVDQSTSVGPHPAQHDSCSEQTTAIRQVEVASLVCTRILAVRGFSLFPKREQSSSNVFDIRRCVRVQLWHWGVLLNESHSILLPRLILAFVERPDGCQSTPWISEELSLFLTVHLFDLWSLLLLYTAFTTL